MLLNFCLLKKKKKLMVWSPQWSLGPGSESEQDASLGFLDQPEA